MRYQTSLKIPANTEATNPASVRLRLTVGKVSHAFISFPAGCQGLVGTRVMRGGHQLWPVMPGEWFVTDDFVVPIQESYRILDEPLNLVFEGYNVDETYDHTITLQLDLLEPHEDPLLQMREIADRVARGTPTIGAGMSIEAQQAILDIRDLTYMIHSTDLQLIYQAIANLRR